jgi:secernin
MATFALSSSSLLLPNRTPKSCDTFIAFGPNRVIFGKNSDRPAGEGQSIRRYPANQWFDDDDDGQPQPQPPKQQQQQQQQQNVQCTYISIPQAPKTHAVLLSQIDWMWGAEHGTNEHGVVIGNEAVWTCVNDEDLATKRLLGMDLVRLGLERAVTAREALTHMTDLLERYGQGGPCAENDSSLVYHNSFLIGDPTEAWILETAGRQWVTKRYSSGSRNISNTLTIRTDYDLHSKGLYDYARRHNLWKGKDDDTLDWAACFGDGAVEECTSKYSRQSCGRALLDQQIIGIGEMTAKDMMEILRDHDGGICMHGGFETTASMVSELARDTTGRGPHTHWMMDTPHPCQNEYQIQPVIRLEEK